MFHGRSADSEAHKYCSKIFGIRSKTKILSYKTYKKSYLLYLQLEKNFYFSGLIFVINDATKFL